MSAVNKLGPCQPGFPTTISDAVECLDSSSQAAADGVDELDRNSPHTRATANSANGPPDSEDDWPGDDDSPCFVLGYN